MSDAALPPSLHFQEPNPHIDFETLRLRVQDELAPWKGKGTRKQAVVTCVPVGPGRWNLEARSGRSFPCGAPTACSRSCSSCGGAAW